MILRFRLISFSIVVLGIMIGSFNCFADEKETDNKTDEKTDEKTDNFKVNDKNNLPPIGITGTRLEKLESDKVQEVQRFVLPPYYSEKSEDSVLKTVLPLFYYREIKGEVPRKDIGLVPFYWGYREGLASSDVFFPLYWRFRKPELKTDIVLQTYFSRGSDSFKFGFAPLLFFGKNKKDQSSHLVIPPLFWHFKNKDKSFTLAGLYYDYRNGDDYKRGLPPLFFSVRKRDKTTTVFLPPLFWHIKDEVNYKTTTILPPLFFKTRQNGWSAGLLPFLYFARDDNWARTLVMPFYYGSRWGEGRSHYFPLLLSYYRRSPNLSQGGLALFYHWYKKDGDYMNMYTPLAWRWGNTRTGEKNVLVPPLFYKKDTPVEDNKMIAMIYWKFHKHHSEKTTAIMPFFSFNKSLYEKRWRLWAAPVFDFGANEKGYHARMHPIFYMGKNEQDSHLVVAPILWHFADKEETNTVVFPLVWNFRNNKNGILKRSYFPLWWQFEDSKRKTKRRSLFPLYWDFIDNNLGTRTFLLLPLYWRVRDAHSAHSGLLNISVHKGEVDNNPFWTFRISPFITIGKPPCPEGARWDFLSGFVGWRRQGSTKELKLFWIPISIGDDDDDKIEADKTVDKQMPLKTKVQTATEL